MKNIFYIIAIMAISCAVNAQQNVSTTLIDSESLKGIESAHIKNKTTGKTVTTNKSGEFNLSGKSSDTLKITSVGYKTLHILIEEAVSKNQIYMYSNVSKIDEVNIVGHKDIVLNVNKLYIKSLDAPVTTNSVSAKLIEQRNATDLGDAMKSATGVRPINRYGGFQTFRIRGFNNFVLLVDGVRDERHNLSVSAPSTNIANIERIEVLKGPASVLYGHSALGGIINLVKKEPSDVQKGEFRTTYGSYNTFNMSSGVGGPITDKLRYRVDFGLTRSSGWRDYGVATNNGSITFDYKPTKNDLIVVSVQANDDNYDTDTGILMDDDGNLVDGMDPKTRYNDPQDFLKHKHIEGQIKYTHKFNNNLKLTEHFSYVDDDINYMSTEWLYFTTNKDSVVRGFPFYFNKTTKTIQNQLDFSYNFETGSIKHKSVIGHSFSSLDRKAYAGDVVGEGAFTTVSVVNPILNQGHIEPKDNNVRSREELVNGIYFQDWLNISKSLKALIGLRYDLFTGTYYRDVIDSTRSVVTQGERTTIPSSALTYRAGLVYQPTKNVSVFGSYSTYFRPSRTITPAGEVFDPESGFQSEVGLKIEESEKLSITASGFYILKKNIVESNKVNEYHQIGEADSKGAELDIYYAPINGFYIKAGYAYTDARVRKFDEDSLQSVAAGNKLMYAPEHLANLWVNYELQAGTAKGLGFGVGMNYTGENYTNSSNTYILPSFATVDAAVYYQAKRIRIGLNFNNVLDKLHYIDAIYDNQFFPGMGRNFKLNMGYKF